MNRSVRLPAWNDLPAPLLGLIALVLGGLLGLVVAAPAIGGAGTPVGRLAAILLPLSGMALMVAISLYSPLAALLLWLVLAPYSVHIPLDISLGAGIPDLSLTRLMTGWLLVLIVAQAARGRRRLRPLTWSDLAFGIFLLAIGLGAFRSYLGTSFALQGVLDAYLIPFLALFLARQIVQNLTDLRWYTAALLVAGVGFAFLIIREQLTGQVLLYYRESAAYSRSFRKIISLMGNAAPMGVSTAMVLPLGLVATVQAFHSERLAGRARYLVLTLLVLANAFVALGVFMTYNRASWLGMALSVVILVALRPRARRLLLPVLLIAAILALIFWQSVINSPAVTERLLEDRSIDYRTTAATLALDMVRPDPLFGLGYYNFGPVAKQNYGWDPAPLFGVYPPAHNSYLFLLVAGGLFAVVPLLAWVLMVAWGGWQRYRQWGRLPRSALTQDSRDALAAGAAVFLTYLLASGTFDNADAFMMNLIFFMTLGAIWGATELSNAAASP
jgi:O-antigen ligase